MHNATHEAVCVCMGVCARVCVCLRSTVRGPSALPRIEGALSIKIQGRLHASRQGEKTNRPPPGPRLQRNPPRTSQRRKVRRLTPYSAAARAMYRLWCRTSTARNAAATPVTSAARQLRQSTIAPRARILPKPCRGAPATHSDTSPGWAKASITGEVIESFSSLQANRLPTHNKTPIS